MNSFDYCSDPIFKEISLRYGIEPQTLHFLVGFDPQSSWATAFMQDRREKILHSIPYIEIDFDSGME